MNAAQFRSRTFTLIYCYNKMKLLAGIDVKSFSHDVLISSGRERLMKKERKKLFHENNRKKGEDNVVFDVCSFPCDICYRMVSLLFHGHDSFLSNHSELQFIFK